MKRDSLTALVLICFGVFVVLEASRMPRFEHLAINPYTVPGIVPGFLGVSIVLFGLVMLTRSFLAARRHESMNERTDGRDNTKGRRRLIITLLLTLGYAAGLVGRIPFWLATFLFVLAFITIFDWREAKATRPKIRLILFAFLQAAVVAVVVTLVFERLFLVRLP